MQAALFLVLLAANPPPWHEALLMDIVSPDTKGRRILHRPDCATRNDFTPLATRRMPVGRNSFAFVQVQRLSATSTLRSIYNGVSCRPISQKNHYKILNGRHRGQSNGIVIDAGYLAGRRSRFPAPFLAASCRVVRPLPRYAAVRDEFDKRSTVVYFIEMVSQWKLRLRLRPSHPGL